MEDQADGGTNVEMDIAILRVRFFVGFTSCAILAISVVGGCFSKIW